jgi:hypothetical protein
MISYASTFVLGLIVGATVASIAIGCYVILMREREESDNATGTPIAAKLAREMKIKLDDFEKRE